DHLFATTGGRGDAAIVGGDRVMAVAAASDGRGADTVVEGIGGDVVVLVEVFGLGLEIVLATTVAIRAVAVRTSAVRASAVAAAIGVGAEAGIALVLIFGVVVTAGPADRTAAARFVGIGNPPSGGRASFLDDSAPLLAGAAEGVGIMS
ncbi:MAG: hypothetical protein AAGD11_20625, partial [Planctomycetota bacterium]